VGVGRVLSVLKAGDNKKNKVYSNQCKKTKCIQINVKKTLPFFCINFSFDFSLSFYLIIEFLFYRNPN